MPRITVVIPNAANIEPLIPAVLDELVSRLPGLRPLRLSRHDQIWGRDFITQPSSSRRVYWPFSGTKPPRTKAIPVYPQASTRPP